jgi:hypothetical protein
MFRKYNDSTKKGSAGEGYEALGMMNLIPNKNECAYLGFYGDYTWNGNDKRSQSWELSDNYSEYFWKKNINVVQRNVINSTYTNDIKGYYEARYPKDTTVFFKTNTNGELEADGDFGMVSKSTITKEECEAVQNEQADLIEFHNWLVSTNRQIPIDYKAGIVDENGNKILDADGNPIPVSQRVPKDNYRELSQIEKDYEWNNGGYTHDTPEYRLAKFEAEAEDHLIVDQFCLYYIWREMFWAYDSGLKNLQIYTMGTNPKNPNSDVMQWGCMVRDADTTLGIQNQGRIEFPPYLEDTDFYTETNGVKTWYFDALRDKYDESDILAINAQGKHILNGQFAPLWINLRDVFGKKIEAYSDKKQKRPYVPKTKKYIQKTVKKIVSIYKKSKRKYYFDFKLMQSFDCDIIEGWKGLLIKKPRNERINNKFSKLMYHQDDDTIEELKNYFNIMTVEEMKEVDSYRIDKYINKNLPIYKIKED